MANLKFGNTNIGKISIIEPPEVPVVEDVYPTGEWVRPAHWLDMPTIGSGEHKAAFLWAIPSGENLLSNFVKINCRGADDPSTTNTNYFLTDFTVDWGDGNSEYQNLHNGQGGATVEHVYDFSSLDPATEFEFRGMRFRQTLVVVDAGASGISSLNWRYITGTQRQYPDLYVLEYNINAPSGEYLGVNQDTYSERFPLLEKARVYGPKVRYLNSMFSETPRLKEVEIHTTNELHGTRSMFSNSALDYLPDFETSGVEMCNGMFINFKNVKIFPSGKYNFDKVYHNPSNNRYSGFSSMFSGSNFEEIHIDVPSGDTGYQNMAAMFRFCKKLKRITGNWDTSLNVSFNETFMNSDNLEFMPRIDFSSVTDIRRGFNETPKLKTNIFPDGRVYMPYLNTTDGSAFSNCAGVKGSIYIEDIGTSGSQNGRMDGLFAGSDVRKVEFSEKPLYTSHIYGFNSMFSSCKKLEYAGYINASGCERTGAIFQHCYNLKKFAGINSYSSTDFNNLFYLCYNLKEVGPIDMSAGGNGNISAQRMFNSCFNLEKLPDLDLSRVWYGYQMFNGMPALSQSGACDFSNMLSSLNSSSQAGQFGIRYDVITDLVIPPDANLNSTFAGNPNLKRVPFVEASGAYTMAGFFNNCYNLEVGTLSGVTSDIGYYRTCLSSGAIEDIFNWLGTANKTIDIRYTPGTYELHADTIAIATSKGWTVTT